MAAAKCEAVKAHPRTWLPSSKKLTGFLGGNIDWLGLTPQPDQVAVSKDLP
jgi:hypothetical protein